MRVSRAQAEKNRENVITVASQLFRKHGFDGVGLKDLMKGAGLTQGAFYKQFASKEDLAAQASERAFEEAAKRWADSVAENPEDPLGAMLGLYLSTGHRDEITEGCPIVALGADASRQSNEVKAPFEAGIRGLIESLGQLIGESGDQRVTGNAMAVLSTMTGAVILSRAVNDKKLSEQILQAAAESIRPSATAGDDPDSGSRA
ncbi:MAG: TetR/AcrR family transcriptional regulator [Alphaproteobacteria bacterium]|nr:TetR/AcrR family transcriptional regulator [Alphaproteobacteria bacterium]